MTIRSAQDSWNEQVDRVRVGGAIEVGKRGRDAARSWAVFIEGRVAGTVRANKASRRIDRSQGP